MKQYREWSLASLFVCLFFLCGCDSTSMKDVAVSSPEILSFSPESGSIGSEIVVTGEYLDDVVSATIGGGKAVILQKVSNRRLSLKVTNQARSGKIVLVNSIGEGVSEGDFTLEYPAPVVSQAGMPSEVEMGNNLLLSGSSMNVVSAVLFTAEGGTEGNEAEIISQSENEIVVKVPYVESDKAIVTFKYFDGTKEVETSSSSAPKLTVKRYQPEVTTTVFEPANVGDMVVLEGAYLNKIDKVLLGDIECTITLQTETELKFVVPTSDSFKNGDNMVGTAVEAKSMGFGGELKVLVGFDAEGKIYNYSLLAHTETPGLGSKADKWFGAYDPAKGEQAVSHEESTKSILGMNPGEAALTVSKDGGQVDAITASTITSRAFLNAVNAAYQAYKAGGGEVNGATGASQKAAGENADAATGATTKVELTDSISAN